MDLIGERLTDWWYNFIHIGDTSADELLTVGVVVMFCVMLFSAMAPKGE